MDRKKIFILVGLLLLVAIVLTVTVSYANRTRPVPPTPAPTLVPTQTLVPTPTMVPPTELTCAGGDIFFIMDPQYLREKYNITVKIEKISTFDVKTSEKLPELDCFFPGSYTAFEDFNAAHPDMVLASATEFRTFGVFLTRADLFLPHYLKYGLVTEVDGKYRMPMAPMIEAMELHWTWEQLFQSQATKMGITYDGDATVDRWLTLDANIYYGAPEYSSGAMQHILFLANCQASPDNNCGEVVREDQLGSLNDPDSIMSFLVGNWEAQPLQIKRSPDWFDAYRAKSGSYPLAASSESLFIGWYNSLPEDKRQTSGRQIVGIYPDYTISTDHVLIALKPEAKVLIDIFKNDIYLQQLAWDRYGMRTAVGDIGVAPGGTDITWMESDPLSLFEPKYEVYQAITQFIHK